MFKKVVQQGRSERRSEAYVSRYDEDLSDARTKLAAFFNFPLGESLDKFLRSKHTALRDDARNQLRRCHIEGRIEDGHSSGGHRMTTMDLRHFERIALFDRDIGSRLGS